MSSYYLAIVGTKDNPIYEAELGSYRHGGNGVAKFHQEQKYMNQFIAHSSLDMIEEVQWINNQMYMKQIDSFSNVCVSVYVTFSCIRFIMLHTTRSDEGLKSFFGELHELYLKTLLNPFYTVDDIITNPIFDTRVKAAAKKYL